MNLSQFLNKIINDGIAAAKKDYSKPSQAHKRNGSIAGFEACRDKSIEELKMLLETSHIAVEDARNRKTNDYWWYRCYEVEIEWVCNCVSAVLYNENKPVIVTPTARGVLKAAEIVGIKGLKNGQ